MRFWQAMKIVDEGGKVRRKDWRVYLARWTYSIYVYDTKAGSKDYIPMYNTDEFIMSDDMMAEDWEVVDPTPTGRGAIEEGLMELRKATRPKFSDYHRE